MSGTERERVYYCATDLHNGVKTGADWYVKGWESTTQLTNRPDDPVGSWSACGEHLPHALTDLELRIDVDHPVFLLRRVTGL